MKAVAFDRKKILVSEISLVFLFTFLMTLSAYVRIPLFFTPVPITLQTFVLFLSIIFLKNRASFSQGAYIFLGVLGLPVFTNGGSGLLYFLDPTGGYLIGFFLASLISPYLLPKEKTFFKSLFFFLCVSVSYFSLAVFWLVQFHKFSFIAAFTAGVLPFIVGDIFKATLASFIYIKTK